MSKDFDVRHFGATGKGVTDDRVAIQRAIDAASAAGGGRVCLGRGTFRLTPAGTGTSWCLRIHSNVSLSGAGPGGTVLKFDSAAATPDGTPAWLLYANGDSITVADLAIDGNKQNAETAYNPLTEHRPGIFAQFAAKLSISNVRIVNCGGDGIQLHTDARSVSIAQTSVAHCNRAGISLTSNVDDVRIVDCEVDMCGLQPIDSEGFNTSVPQNVTIMGSRLGPSAQGDYTVTVSGTTLAQSKKWQIVGNHITGEILVRNAAQVTITGNTLVMPNSAASCILCDYKNDQVAIAGNTMKVENTVTAFVAAIFVEAKNGGFVSSGVVVTGNTIDCSTAIASACGMLVNTANDLLVEGNTFTGPGGIATGGCGIQVRPTSGTDNFRSAVIRGNRITNFGQRGITVVGGAVTQILSVDISGNTFDKTSGGMNTAISLGDSEAHQVAQITMIGNSTSPGVPTLASGYPAAVPVLIGGNRDANPVYSISGPPEGVVTGPIGSTAYRRDGGVGATFYVKESNTTPQWVAK